ncbi:hypothetical protein EVAR_81297_1 [Eumeta japonica]|uniref:Uncharacterized protein n=1 Tax=Eumeta variegata TaxID=151549 RepID=A0A4C1W2G6_EUMVA|nr:hypothetical protein EVAR_81297_1 [Eumeta japonica]
MLPLKLPSCRSGGSWHRSRCSVYLVFRGKRLDKFFKNNTSHSPFVTCSGAARGAQNVGARRAELQHTKLCRCEVSHEYVALAQKRKKERLGRVEPAH